MNIRILPMSQMEFATEDDVLQFLMADLPGRGGDYHYRRKSIVYKEDILIAFQYNSKIVASAIMIGEYQNEILENGILYKGYYQFDTNSFVRCEIPVTAQEIKRIMPDFKGFNQSTQFLSNDCYDLLGRTERQEY